MKGIGVQKHSYFGLMVADGRLELSNQTVLIVIFSLAEQTELRLPGDVIKPTLFALHDETHPSNAKKSLLGSW